MKYIPLTKGAVAVVCDCHYDQVAQNKWYFDGRYAARHQWDKKEKRYYGVYMHRVIANPPGGLDTDHRDQDKLNNQCSNLRVVTRSQNLRNKASSRPNKSGHKGVIWDKSRNKWKAYANPEPYKHLALGRFDTKEEAIARVEQYYQ